MAEPFPVGLADVAAAIPGAEIRGDADLVPTEVAYDSRAVSPGSLFFCVSGGSADGHAFASEAVARGAVALVVERWLDLEVPQVRVGSVREAMGPISGAMFGHPATAMRTVGVTGTDGKTTTTYLLEAVFARAGLRPGVIGTIGGRIDGAPVALDRTTPEAPDLQRLLARMRDTGVEAVAMEVSSHGLDQHRFGGIRCDVAVFTNLSRDHLDYHGSIEAYFAAKATLFTERSSRAGIVNADDRWGVRLARIAGVPITTFGLGVDANVRAADLELSAEGSSFLVDGLRVHTRLRGRFNVENCLATIATARRLGLADEAIVDGIAALEAVPGRMQSVDAGQDFLVMVDYAHTPDSIRSVLRGARPLTAGKVIVVFGCGGDRDPEKRPLMGRAATEIADLAIITSDNPRSEEPEAIIGSIVPGAEAGGGTFVVEPDRRRAIRMGLRAARSGDVVVIAGKGHETEQEFADHIVPFDDRAVAHEELRDLVQGSG